MHSQAHEAVCSQAEPLPASSLSPEAALDTCSFSLGAGFASAASPLQFFRSGAGAFLCLVHHVRLLSCKGEQREIGERQTERIGLSVPKWPPRHLPPCGTRVLFGVISPFPCPPSCTGAHTLGEKVGTIQLELKNGKKKEIIRFLSSHFFK